MYWGHFSLFHRGRPHSHCYKIVCIGGLSCADEIYEHVSHVFEIQCAQAFSLKIYCGFNIESYYFFLSFVYIKDIQLAEICRNMGICDVSGQWPHGKYIPDFTSFLIIKEAPGKGEMERSGDRFKNTYELLNVRALKFSCLNKMHIFQCMGKILCVEFQRVPLKYNT